MLAAHGPEETPHRKEETDRPGAEPRRPRARTAQDTGAQGAHIEEGLPAEGQASETRGAVGRGGRAQMAVGRWQIAIILIAITLVGAVKLFLWEVYSPEYGFEMPWIQT